MKELNIFFSVNASEGVEPHITDHDLNVAVKVAEEIISKWQRLENNLVGEYKFTTDGYKNLKFSYIHRTQKILIKVVLNKF